MELKNRSFQYGKYRFRTIACMPHLEARRGRYQPSSYVLGPLSQNLSWCRSPCRYLELPSTELMFIEPGVKINDAYYRDILLVQHLLPAIRSVAGASSLTMLQLTELVTPWSFCLAIHQISSYLCRGHPIALT